MAEAALDPFKFGVTVECSVCHRRKKPVGRDALPMWANSWCDFECTGYAQKPHVGHLWPGESENDFGHSVPNEGTNLDAHQTSE